MFEQKPATKKQEATKNDAPSLQEREGSTEPTDEKTEAKPLQTDDAREDACSKFPKIPVWVKALVPEKGKKLESLYKEYRKACNKQQMRTQRAQDAKEVDEDIRNLLRQAWVIARTLHYDNCNSSVAGSRRNKATLAEL